MAHALYTGPLPSGGGGGGGGCGTPISFPSCPQCVRGDLPTTRGAFHTGFVPTIAAGGGRLACGLGLSPALKSSWNARMQTSWPVAHILT